MEIRKEPTLVAVRKTYKVSQTEIAKLMKTNQATISKIERNPKDYKFRRIVQYIDTIDYILNMRTPRHSITQHSKKEMILAIYEEMK